MLTETAYRGGWAHHASLTTPLRLAFGGPRNHTLAGGSTTDIMLPRTVRSLGGVSYPDAMPGARAFYFEVPGSVEFDLRAHTGAAVQRLMPGNAYWVHLLDALSETWRVSSAPLLATPAPPAQSEKLLVAPGASLGTALQSYDPVADGWTPAGLSVPQGRPAGVLIGAPRSPLVYVGSDAGGALSLSVDFSQGPTTSLVAAAVPDLPVSCVRGSGVVMGDRVYVSPGSSGAKLYRLAADRRSWELVADGGTPRERTVMLSSGQRIYLLPSDPTKATGLVYDTITSRFWPMNAWSGTERTDFAAFALNGSLWLCGGRDRAGNVLDEVLRYETARQRWTQGPPMPGGPREQCGGGYVAGWGVVFGGLDPVSAPLQRVERFDGNAWHNAANLPTADSDMQNRAATVFI